MASRPQDNTAVIHSLTMEVANAYKIASDRAQFQINTLDQERTNLLRQLEQAKKTEAGMRIEMSELQRTVGDLQNQLGELQLKFDRQTPAPGDNVLTM